jgi:hypothetical protein
MAKEERPDRIRQISLPEAGRLYAELIPRLPNSLDSIDRDLQDLPSLIREASDQATLFAARSERAKEQLDTVEAEVYLDTKRRAADAGDKLTEIELKKIVALDPRVREAEEKLIFARRDQGLWTNLQFAFQAKSKSLDYTVRLIQTGWYVRDSYPTRRERDSNRGGRNDTR